MPCFVLVIHGKAGLSSEPSPERRASALRAGAALAHPFTPSGAELPLQEAPHAPAPQFTTAPSQAAECVPHAIEQEPDPQLKARSPQELFRQVRHSGLLGFIQGMMQLKIMHYRKAGD